MGLFDSWKTDRPTFVKRIRKALVDAGLSEDLSYDEERFAFIVGERTIQLQNVYRDFCAAARKDRKGVLEHYVRAIASSDVAEMPSTWAEAKGLVMPVVRSPAYYQQFGLEMKLHADPDAKLPEFKKLLAGVVAVDIAVDMEDSMAMVDEEKLTEWQISIDDALEQATTNLRDQSTDPMYEVAPGLFGSEWGDSYDSSRMLCPDVLHRHAIKGQPVVMAPVRDVLMLTGDRDDDGLQAMVQLAEQFLEQPRWISFEMLRHDGETWGVFTPPGDIARGLTDLHVQERAADYEQQKELLDALHERDGVDVFVASFMGFSTDEDGSFSVCSWTKGVPSWLPETNIVMMIDPDRGEEDQVQLPWDVVVSSFGHLMERVPDLWPPRHAVTDFPDDTMLESARSAAERDGD